MPVGLIVLFSLALFIILAMTLSYASKRVQVKHAQKHHVSSDVPVHGSSYKDNASCSYSGDSSSSSGGGSCD
ncbi:hypothetical protein PQ478_19480 [Alkalihalophilus pseudofirmus]|uniref:hypothetical protein n=1 Tax=Alkalihalophilus pseudofirmus TaxID=79885 RepID=UPI00259B4BC8|nr:hypothetical protein [Alkalihalophilus pseudofirmus]WEG16661.1 hypothetical protein PQ478_19480 [Alkalihalophilus pseudofirmus]